MIKILNVLSDTNIGGAGKCLLTYLDNYDAQNFAVSVILPQGSLLIPQVEQRGVEVYTIDNAADSSFKLSAIKKYKKLIRQIAPDIVHTHASMSARIAAKRLGLKVVYTRHSVFDPPKSISTWPGKQINGFINNKTCHKIIAVADAAKENLLKTGINGKKITVILNGISGLRQVTQQETDEFRQRFGISPGQKVASMIARLEDVKGHKYFINAAKLVLEQGIDAKFLIAGTGVVEQSLKEQVTQLGLEKSVIFTGFLQDVAPLVSASDIIANASYGTEATSIALLEGMSVGKVSVVSDFGGNPGVIEQGVNGLVFKTHDQQGMADCLARLFKDEALYEEMSKNARRVFEEKFTAKAMTRQMEQLYASLIKTNQTGKE